MKTLYFQCAMGAAGDMLTAALLELFPEREQLVEELNALGLPGVRFSAAPSVKCGVTGTHVTVTVDGQEEHSHDVPLGRVHEHGDEHSHKYNHEHSHEHSCEHGHEHSRDHAHEHSHEHGHEHSYEHVHEHSLEHSHEHGHTHHHAGMHDIEHIVSHLQVPEQVRRDVLAVYGLIAQAESHAHGVPVEEIHFHEVGTLDAVADVTAVCLLMHRLAPDQVLCSPVHVGSGQVRCAHGILPVPAPATAHILQGVPTYGGEIAGELCTPTGAALLKHFVTRFGPAPVMRVERTGYGMGTKDFAAMNGLRAMLGETEEAGDEVAELACNLDDMTPEAIAFGLERLMAAGALDVFTTPIGMKKGRPGVMLTCLCRPEDREKMAGLLFAHTTTLGVRERLCSRYVLSRAERTEHTPFGDLRVKSARGWGVSREKPEHNDLARVALEQGWTLAETREKLGL